MSDARDEGILTLEPLIEAVRGAVEGAGWELSGLQKTTSHQFEGRWDGESTRSAYLFFHSPASGTAEVASIDAYLDETSRGLSGNIALVVDLAPLGALGDPNAALRRLGALSAATISAERRRPLTLRLRLSDASTAPGQAESEVRFKVSIPRAVIGRGEAAVAALTEGAVHDFERILGSSELAGFLEG